MGGKKKKSATVPTVQPVAAGNNVPAAGNGVADPATTGKKQKPTPAKAAVKDIKPKGPKTYSLTNTAQVDTGGVTDKSILKVVIQTDLEKKIIKLINDFRQENGDKGPISGRLTNKKLLDLYLALQKFKFKTEHIEEAMKSSVLYGGDLHSALDWLCLNLNDGTYTLIFKLSVFFYPLIAVNFFTDPLTDSFYSSFLSFPPPPLLQRSCQQVSNDRYLVLTAQLYDAKEMAATAKAKKDKGGQRTAQDRIRVIQQEMKPLESHPMFNTVIKVVDTPKIEEKKPPAPTEGKEELAFGLFEQAEKETPPPAEKTKNNEPKDIRNFDYTARSWTGKSPKQFLIDWVRKNLPKSPAPSFQKVAAGRYWKCRVRVQRLDDVLEFCPNILTEDGMQAQHLGATLAIYNLCKGQSSLCGYQIRMENKSSDSTRLLYCTTGVLLRKLQQDHMLSSLTHIIVDEVHERSVQSDFLLTILKDVVQKRSNLHLVMMSATVDCDKFAAYFNRCPIVNIPGRTFPVEVFHLEDIVEETGYVLEKDSEYSQKILEEEEEVNINFTQKGGKSMQHQEFIVKDSGSGWDLGPDLDHFSSRTRHALQYMNPNKINMELVLDLLDYLDKSPQFAVVDGAVLVFLPGLAHIQQLYDLLSTDKRFRGKDRYKLVALHSTLSSKDQAAAFTVPPTGVRKIVLSTNIAETGVTIPDVVFVIDTGKTKENKYHESSQMSSLVETFVSKASALQRQGRAGRVRDGFCFRLYPKFRFQAFMDYSIPEILRVPLEELCLHIMKCEYGSPEEFLCRALDAPQPQSVSNAVCLLRRIGACIPEGHALTPLGHHLATLPVNVKIGKMLIFGAILGCLDPIATIAAAISEKSPFATPMNQKDQANLAKAALAVANSDHLTIYNAYLGWKNIRSEGYRAEMAYCRKHFLNRTALITIEDIKQELMRMMDQAGFSGSSRSGRGPPSRDRSDPRGPQAPLTPLGKPQICVLNAVLTAGLYDSVGRILYTPSVDVLDRVACSVETAQGKAQVHPSSVNRCLQTRGWLLFQEKVKYSKIYLRDTTLISPFPMLLFGGDIDVQHRERLISLDGWIHFQAPVRIGVIFKHLRKLIDSLLEKKLENPRMNLEDEKTIQLIIELIKMENVF
uniref:RNA helicase n=1 Tax=Oncorhynchus kisutch TaxID=8019 RepID=A0A8C7CNP6_ONCKI